MGSDEKAIVQKYSGSIGWPTVLLAFVLVGADVAVIALWLDHRLPLFIGFVVNSLVAYASYTVHHDATHKAISGRRASLAWLDTLCGTVASGLVLLEYKGYASNHLRHHAHTNKNNDPDLLVKGPLWQVPLKWVFLMTLAAVGSVPLVGDKVVGRIVSKLVPPGSEPLDSDETRGRMRRINQLALLIVLLSIPFGAFVPTFLLWYLPSRIGILLLMVLFQWLPHFPFDRTDRFGATRVNRFPFSTWLLLQQDRHLVHHLYPSIPWYRYRAAYRELRPILEANGAIIQGIDTSPRIPIQLRTVID